MTQIVVTYKFNSTVLCSSQETDTGISKSILDILWSILLLLDLRHFLVNMEHIKQHYCESQPTMDPFEIIPIGPNMTTLLDMTLGRLATQNVSVTFLLTIFFFFKEKNQLFFIFYIEFQLMAFIPDDNSVSSDQNTNWFLM